MKLDKSFIQQCEALIAKGDVAKAIDLLLAAKDQTALKNQILSLSNRWKIFSRDQLSGTLSGEEESLQTSKFNMELLQLLNVLQRELDGEKISPKAPEKPKVTVVSTHNPFLSTYLPILLTALAVWGICYFAYHQAAPPAPACEMDLNLDGSWNLYLREADGDKEGGNANIYQDKCERDFQVSGAFITPAREHVDFSSKIGGFNDGEIFFIYENINGEMGICRGAVPSNSDSSFSVHYFDLQGYDRNDDSKGQIVFKRKATTE